MASATRRSLSCANRNARRDSKATNGSTATSRKYTAAYRSLAKELDDKAWCSGEQYSLADIATGCALGYLDLRHPAIDWRTAFPNLVRLADKLAKRPSFAETAPPSP